MILLERHDQLGLESFTRVSRERVPVEIAPAALERVAAGRAAMEAALERGEPAYGVTTGLGHLGARPVAPEDRLALQRSILVGRATGLGEPLPEEVVRGAMLLRLTGFLGARSGVTPGLCRVLAERLNDGWYPLVPDRPAGTAGETIPLCHLFQTLIGEGEVIERGERVPAAAALAGRGAAPYELELKEGLALINGAPLAPAQALPLVLRAGALLDQASLAGALSAALTGASPRPYSARVSGLKGDPGQARVQARLAGLLAPVPPPEGVQAPVSLRVLPQVHGAAHDQLDGLRAQLERELRAVTDSPLYLPAEGDEPEGFYSSGNFHSQALCFWLDSVAVALAQVALLSERRLHRLLDGRFSHLPDQLSPDPGRGQAGVVALHKSVVGLSAENRLLAAPASLGAVDTSTGQEDVQSFASLAAAKLGRLLDNLELALAYELVALRQARALRPAAPLAPELAGLTEALAAVVEPVTRDRSLAPDVERVAALLRSARLVAAGPVRGRRQR